jgi:ABC-2 type transport system ATP-binding protein
MVTLENFSKTYGKHRAVAGITFSAHKGEITGLLGPNGSGKTTVLKAAAAIHVPTDGAVCVEGFDTRRDGRKVRALTGYAPENAGLLPEFTVREMLCVTADITVGSQSAGSRSAVREAVETFSLADVLSVRVSRLSKGYAQRLSLALALLHDPPVLILDEPASGLDPAQIHELRRHLKHLAHTKTILLSTHLIGEAELLCSRICIMHGGTLAASGTKEEILEHTHTKSLEHAYMTVCGHTYDS